ncbi:hypothetical protein SISNIDRAFT_469276 [Sistotremastrum niveocremeum HHB9708]|uniref:Uncharacterized protein n=1 Tax=Sistotremastrum niveocremeum HHB9708 TaxID=1314777 RepID=A0A164QBF7_9AGAM|nr:hypothetical protein SISNIDRAFT_469276 [Sistotremastrum niveocremeum HHB9708]
MRLLLSLPLALLSLPLLSLAQTASYFNILSPTSSSVWSSDALGVLSWVTSPNEGIDNFDVELARISVSGLIFIARAVPTALGFLNIELQSIPSGTDYFFMLVNSTNGQNFAISDKFTISSPNSSSSSSSIAGANPVAGAPTVTATGGPDPTVGFQATLGPVVGAAVRLGEGRVGQVAGLLAGLCAALVLFLFNFLITVIARYSIPHRGRLKGYIENGMPIYIYFVIMQSIVMTRI